MTSPWMTTRELAEYLRFVDKHGLPQCRLAYRWVIAKKVPYKHRGPRAILVRRDDVDAKLESA